MLSGHSAHNKLPSVSEIWDSGSSSLNDIIQSQASKTQWRLEESASKTHTRYLLYYLPAGVTSILLQHKLCIVCAFYFETAVVVSEYKTTIALHYCSVSTSMFIWSLSISIITNILQGNFFSTTWKYNNYSC